MDVCSRACITTGTPTCVLCLPLPHGLPPPEEDDSFDIYLSYPKDVTNIDKMYLKCEWYELEDAHVAVALSDDTPTAL
jgi:hypothetical protein